MAYRGVTAPIPIGLAGLHGSKNPSKLSAAHMGFVEGVDVDGGLLRKDGGVEQLNTTELNGTVISGTNWSPVADVRHDVVFLSNGTVVRDLGSGTFPDIIASGLIISIEPPPSFVLAGGESVGSSRKLFMFSAGNQVRYVEGESTDMNAITEFPADWSSDFPTCGAHHRNRLWGAGNISDPHRIYYSTISDHTDFTGGTSGTLPVFPGEGERIVGMISFRGLLVVWKYPLGVYAVDTRNSDVSEWSVAKISTAVGGLNQHTLVPVDGDVLYMDHAGNIHLLSATEIAGDFNTSNISQVADINKFMRDNVNLTRLRRGVAIWYSTRRLAYFFLPRKGNFENDLRLTVDMSDPESGVRFFTSRRDVANAAWIRPDSDLVPRPVIGEEGFVQRLDRDVKNKNGEAYTMELETAEIDFGFVRPEMAWKEKNGEFIKIVSDITTSAILEIDVYWDDVFATTLNFDISSQGVPIGEFELGVDELAASGKRITQKRLPGSGSRLRLKMRNVGLDEEVGISAFYVSFSVMDEWTGR